MERRDWRYANKGTEGASVEAAMPRIAQDCGNSSAHSSKVLTARVSRIGNPNQKRAD